jgi:hypothetical protein
MLPKGGIEVAPSLASMLPNGGINDAPFLESMLPEDSLTACLFNIDIWLLKDNDQ